MKAKRGNADGNVTENYDFDKTLQFIHCTVAKNNFVYIVIPSIKEIVIFLNE